MKIAAYFALGTGLAAAIAAVVVKLRTIRKIGKTTRQDVFLLVFLPLFALLMIVNLILVTLYF